MKMVDILEKKRDGKSLSQEEIQFWIDGVVQETIPLYQSSAMLMAIAINGMSHEETSFLTLSMMHSGDIIDLSAISGLKVDKHSTGGVGDKTSLVLSPIVAAAGAKVAKMSGRGLGHTGGTLDKLESIAGFNIEMSGEDFIKQVNEINLALVGQSDNLVYADKVLYGLRDVTGTVASIPLIASSIMSKKLAGGADAIFLDVKYGEGAFMKTVEEARELAETMIAIGKHLDREVNAMISNMNQPLGKTIGNALEVREAVETLQNQGPKELEELCLLASSYMLKHAGLAEDIETGRHLAEESLRSGAAYKKFQEWIAYQGGDLSFLDDLEAFSAAKHRLEVRADRSGYLHDIHALELGKLSVHLGAGRFEIGDALDYQAGIQIEAELGDYIEKGQLLCILQSNASIKSDYVEEALKSFIIEEKPRTKIKLIEEVL